MDTPGAVPAASMTGPHPRPAPQADSTVPEPLEVKDAEHMMAIVADMAAHLSSQWQPPPPPPGVVAPRGEETQATGQGAPAPEHTPAGMPHAKRPRPA